VQKPGPYQREQQQRHQQPGAGGRDGTNGGDASRGTGGPDRLPALRQRLQVLHDLLEYFDVGQDRQQLGRPPRHAVVTPVLAGAALVQMAGQGQPGGCRQHDGVPPAVLLLIAVTVSVSQQVPQFPAPGGPAAKQVQRQVRIGERGDLKGAQYRLPVLATQSANLGDGGPEFRGRVAAVQAPDDEQLVHPLPGFGQRGHDLLQPAP
jgi:hypothetical protein